MTRVSVRAAATKARKADDKLHQKWDSAVSVPTADSFANFAARMGVNTQNISAFSTYGFNPITRVRTLLEWIHRGSWLGGVAVDLKADDMTRAGVEFKGDLAPDKVEQLEEAALELNVWGSINEVIKWSRLYGGAIGVYMIKGQDVSTPLRLETVGKDQFKGIYCFDRWQYEASLSNLVTEEGPNLGKPKFYRIASDGPAYRGKNIHYSRVFHIVGIKLPYWQRVMENMEGISVIERLYDRMIAFDSATQGAAQLVYKSYLRTLSVKGLRTIIAAGGPKLQGLTAYVNMLSTFQSIEGMAIIDEEDKLEATTHAAFGGLSDALAQFGQQLSGALQIPLIRLFGESPAGFNTGESDLRTYYDGINQEQNSVLRLPVNIIYTLIAASLGIKLPKGFKPVFKSLWQYTEEQKANIASTITTSVIAATEAGLASQKTGMLELRGSGDVTGLWQNIGDDEIEAAEEELPPTPTSVEVAAARAGGEDLDEEQKAAEGKAPKPKAPATKTKDAVIAKIGKIVADEIDRQAQVTKTRDYTLKAARFEERNPNLQVVIETPQGTVRRGRDWMTTMPADYGYLRRYEGADGDQIDCYIGPSPDSDRVWIVDQRNLETGKFDEHKVMLAYLSEAGAMEDYRLGHSASGSGKLIGGVTEMSLAEFERWLSDSANLTKPCSPDYKDLDLTA